MRVNFIFIHGSGCLAVIVGLQMLSKVVSSVATSSTRKIDAQNALAAEFVTYTEKQTASNLATEEFSAFNLQAEKEKAMIAQIRVMVINLNKGQFTNFASCRDMKVLLKMTDTLICHMQPSASMLFRLQLPRLHQACIH